MIYRDLSVKRRRKNKANSKPIAGSWPEILSTKLEILNDLKKQSQFVMAQLNISISDIRCYGILNKKRRRTNKANQSQIPPNGAAGKRRRANSDRFSKV